MAASDFPLSETAFLDYNHSYADSLDPDDPNDRVYESVLVVLKCAGWTFFALEIDEDIRGWRRAQRDHMNKVLDLI